MDQLNTRIALDVIPTLKDIRRQTAALTIVVWCQLLLSIITAGIVVSLLAWGA